MNNIITKEERKEAIAILKEALVKLGTKENKYSINITTHMLYNYFRNKNIDCGIKNIRQETKEIYRYKNNWESSSYYQDSSLKPYIAKINELIGKDKYQSIVGEISCYIK